MSCATIVVTILVIGLLVIVFSSLTLKEGNAFQTMHMQMNIPGPEPSGPPRPLYYTRWGHPALEVYPNGVLTSNNPPLAGTRMIPESIFANDIGYGPEPPIRGLPMNDKSIQRQQSLNPVGNVKIPE